MKRAIRLLKMVRALERGPCTIHDLAIHCGVTERTIYRDLLDLQTEAYEPVIDEHVWRIIKDLTESVTD